MKRIIQLSGLIPIKAEMVNYPILEWKMLFSLESTAFRFSSHSIFLNAVNGASSVAKPEGS